MGAIKESGRTLRQIERVPYRDAFLIADLLTSRITFLSGEPKAGKSLLAAGMVTALMTGAPTFLDQPVHRKINRVVFGLTDDGADEELKERIPATVDSDQVITYNVRKTEIPGYWQGVRDDLRDIAPGLFVLDNVIGALPDGGDISSSAVSSALIDNLRPIAESGIPVLVVTHTPKANTEGLSVASSPIGSRAMAGGARGVIALRKTSRGKRKVQTVMNRAAAELDVEVDVERADPWSEVPAWSVVRVKPKAAEVAAPWADVLAARVLAEQPGPTSLAMLGTLYAPEVGRAERTVRVKLGEKIAHDGEKWVKAA